LQVSGPHAPDTVFMRARQGEFDVVIAMYHDQGLIPVKLMGLADGVNTTLGLPMVRTSPDHGTAFDLAGSGRADPSSLLAAIDAALDMTGTDRS
jgi:4-hydroxythreonine-4-phosphate dehydrogenase